MLHRHRAAAFAGTLLTLLAVAAPAVATPPGNVNAGDPHQTGCDTTERLLKSMTLRDGAKVAGYAYMRYSTGCQTQWLTVNLSAGYAVDPSIWIQNTTGTTLHESYGSPGAGAGTQWTFQLEGMRYQTGCSGAQLYRVPGYNWISWNYLGCA